MVLVHGFPLDQQIWDPVLPELSKDFTVYTLDLPGLGQTPPMSFRTLEELAHWLHNWVGQTIAGPIILVGHSMGGYLAMEYVRMFADDLLAMVLFHSHVFGDTPEKQQLRGKAVQFVKEHGTHAYLKTMVPDLFTKTYREAHEDTVNALMARMGPTPPEVIANYLEAMRGRSDRSALLDNLPVPIQFIASKEDAHAPYGINVEQVAMAKQSQLITLEGVSHMGMMEDPVSSVEALKTLKEWMGKYR
jgi:pimeloyl-ACP methyl ester carboxylesterase